MRIAMIAHHVAPIAPPFSGGVESATWSLAAWLANRGHEVDLYGPPGSAIPGVRVHELDLSAPISEAARQDISMPPDRFMDAHYAYQKLMLALSTSRDRYHVIHSHSLHYLPVAMCQLVATPMILTLHCPPTPWLQSALRLARRGRPVLVAVSKATRNAWAPAADVRTTIGNGVELAGWAVGPGGSGVAWTGRIVPEKAPHLAIRAARLSGRMIRLAGPIIDHRYWAEEVEPLLGPGCEYLGHLRHEALCSMVSHSAVQVVSSVWDEPFGLVAAEAMACGTPVAAFARGGLTELIAGGGGVLADREDVEALARAIDAAAALPRDGVRAHAEQTVSIDAMGEAHERLYHQLRHRLERSSRRRHYTRDGDEPPRAASVR